jgi:hypothetical protein
MANSMTALSGFFYVLFLPTFIVNLFFALAVNRDANRLQGEGSELFLVSGRVWAFATLLGGVTVTGIYWFVHHRHWATLRRS